MAIDILDALRITTEKIKEYINEKQVDVDTTLKEQGKAADAKAVGDAIANIDLSSTELITTADIDEICGTTIHTSSEVEF